MTGNATTLGTDTFAGELRFVANPSGGTLPSGVHARLVLVLGAIGNGIVQALLVTEDVDIAGPADVILTRREHGRDIELSVHADLPVSLTVDQLGDQFARLDESVLDVIKQASADQEMPSGPVADALHRGLPIGPLHPGWQFKEDELLDVRKLGQVVARMFEAMDS